MTYSHAIIARLLIGISLLVFANSAARAASPESINNVKHQITGLFSPDRVEDLRMIIAGLEGIKLIAVDFAKAEGTFHYDVTKVFPNAKQPGQAVNHFNNLLRQASRNTFGVKPLCSVSRDKMELITIPVVGLDCKGCSFAAYEAIFRLEGVEQATASFRDGLVTAWIHPEKIDRATLEENLTNKKVALADPK